MEGAANLIILGCWIVFAAYWMISALSAKRVAERQSLGSALAHRIPAAAGFWLIFFFRFPEPLKLPVLPRTDLVNIQFNARGRAW